MKGECRAGYPCCLVNNYKYTFLIINTFVNIFLYRIGTLILVVDVLNTYDNLTTRAVQ